MDHMKVYNVKGVTGGAEPTENYHHLYSSKVRDYLGNIVENLAAKEPDIFLNIGLTLIRWCALTTPNEC